MIRLKIATFVGKVFWGSFVIFIGPKVLSGSLKPESIGERKQGSKAQRKQGLKTGTENRD